MTPPPAPRQARVGFIVVGLLLTCAAPLAWAAPSGAASAFGAVEQSWREGAASSPSLPPGARPGLASALDHASVELRKAADRSGVPRTDADLALTHLLAEALAAVKASPQATSRTLASLTTVLAPGHGSGRLAPAGAGPVGGGTLTIGPFTLDRATSLNIVGPRAGRDRMSVVARLKEARPDQAAGMTADDMVALVPALVAAAAGGWMPSADLESTVLHELTSGLLGSYQ